MPTYETQKGSPSPLGTSQKGGGVNFALYSEHATKVTLCLFKEEEHEPFVEIDLNKTEKVWHILVLNLPEKIDYGYRIDGPKTPGQMFNPGIIVSDPYARALSTCHKWGEGYNLAHPPPPRGRLVFDKPFDWEGVKHPRIPMEKMIIYEMHVRGFTFDSSSHAHHPGSFLGVIEKIPYLKELGVNVVELLPIFEFNECENPRKNPLTQEPLSNFWGYSTVNFFCPMNRYATEAGWSQAALEFKQMVKELHRNGIEVILDVVYNHTAEGNENGPYFSFRGIDNANYYILTPDFHYANYTGCGNTFNCNHPVTRELILDSLRYWASEMGVDGFRFDLASIFTRDPTGAPIPNPPVIVTINSDPILKESKLIAEAWDAAGLYQVGSFPGEGRWAEWNGVYRDAVRRFIKGTMGESGNFANALCGSQNLYGKDRNPYHSINFVTAHDGYTLRDLVSYQEKHNESNGENNSDGANNNESWNCGQEGETKKQEILQLRARQMRNFYTALLLSLGTPMLFMGDEYGHTRFGNNNGWCHDDKLNWFLWDELKKHKEFFRFVSQLIHFRRKETLLHRIEFLTNEDIDWHGHMPFKANWDHLSRFVAYTLKGPKYSLYIAFNADYQPVHITLPPPPAHQNWYRVLDTSLPSPLDFVENPSSQPNLKYIYNMPSYSAIVAKSF